MSDTPRTDEVVKFIRDQLNAETYLSVGDLPYYVLDLMWKKCCELERELAAAQERISELKKLIPLVEEVRANHRDPQSGEYNECEKPGEECMWCDLVQKAIDGCQYARIAELETLLREVLRQGCEYHTKKYALLQMDHALIQEIADAIDATREKEGDNVKT